MAKFDDDDDRQVDNDSKNNLWIIILLLLFILLLSGFIIGGIGKGGNSQTSPQITQTVTQPISQSISQPASPSAAQVTNSPCSPVPFVCLINGKGVCVRPTVCPSQLTCNPVPLPSKITIHFDFDLYTIKPVDMPALNKFAEVMKKDPLATITIDGNTDSIPFIPGTKGPITNNQALSMARALAAKNYLVGRGVTNKFKLTGYGYSKPVAPNSKNGKDNPSGRALNRRDEISASSNAPLCSAPTPSASPSATPTPTVTPTPALCNDNSTNSLQGGYTFSPPPTTTKQLSVNAQWNVVNATCKSNEQGFTSWTGIKTNDMLIQAGSYAWCSSSGIVQYFPWTMAYPGPMANPPNVDTVSVGDTLYSSITMDKPGSFVIDLMNITKGWSYQVTANDPGFTSLSPNSGQVYVQDEPSQGVQSVPQLSQFSPDANFTNGQFSINGSGLAPLSTAPGLMCHNIIRNKTILEQTTGITQGDFNETWKQP